MSVTHLNLRPVGSFAQHTGVKGIIYGPPGTGKTPIICTAPEPVIFLIEPGALSVRSVKDIAGYAPRTVKELDDCIEWVLESKEAKQFQSFCFDSLSEMAAIKLQEIQAKSPSMHGLQQYGKAGEWTIAHLRKLYHFKGGNVFFNAKQDNTVDGRGMMTPSYIGKMLPVEVPHLFDAVLHVEKINVTVDGKLEERTAFRTRETTGCQYSCRDRSGVLDEFEPADLTYIVNKIKTGVA